MRVTGPEGPACAAAGSAEDGGGEGTAEKSHCEGVWIVMGGGGGGYGMGRGMKKAERMGGMEGGKYE